MFFFMENFVFEGSHFLSPGVAVPHSGECELPAFYGHQLSWAGVVLLSPPSGKLCGPQSDYCEPPAW